MNLFYQIFLWSFFSVLNSSSFVSHYQKRFFFGFLFCEKKNKIEDFIWVETRSQSPVPRLWPQIYIQLFFCFVRETDHFDTLWTRFKIKMEMRIVTSAKMFRIFNSQLFHEWLLFRTFWYRMVCQIYNENFCTKMKFTIHTQFFGEKMEIFDTLNAEGNEYISF